MWTWPSNMCLILFDIVLFDSQQERRGAQERKKASDLVKKTMWIAAVWIAKKNDLVKSRVDRQKKRAIL